MKNSVGTEITDQNNIGNINPYRYRGYSFDSETGMYYLQSRYYSPEWGRFLNADGIVSTGQGLIATNMYVYCINNPMNYTDETGNRPIAHAISNNQHVSPRCSTTPTTTASTPTKVSPSLISLTKSYEKFYSTPYDDGAGNITIGYGHVIQKGEIFTSITMTEAETLLGKDLGTWEQAVYKYSNELNIVWDQNQYDAFVDLAFNAGYNYEYVVDRIYKENMTPEAAFLYAYNTQYKDTNVGLGLYRRRMDQLDVYLYGNYTREYRNP